MLRKDSSIVKSLSVLFAGTALALLCWGSVSAQVAGPGWHNVKANPVTPTEAQAYYSKIQSVLKQQSATQQLQGPIAMPMAVAHQTNEIIELARALKYDPKLIYEYIHNHMDYVPYFGLLKGPTRTLLDRSGNDFDQASLMIELLRASGHTAQYAYGVMNIPNSSVDNKDLQHWTGVETGLLSLLFANGGMPHTANGSSTLVQRVWVKAVINGTAYVFDPAFKVYDEINKIDLGAAMGYTPSAVISAAGGEIGADYVRNLNDSGLQSLLVNYSNNFVSYIRANHPNAEIEDVIGGRSIVPELLTALPTSLPFSPTESQVWNEVPDAFLHKVTLQHGSITTTQSIPEISDKKLALTYSGGGTTPSANQPAATCTASGGTGSTLDFGSIYPLEYLEKCIDNPLSPGGGTTSVFFVNNPEGAFVITEGGGTTTGSPHIRIQFQGSSPGTKTAVLRIASHDFPLTADINLTGVINSAPVAQFWLDDVLLTQGAVTVDTFNRATLTLSVDHPYAAFNGTLADDSTDYQLTPGATYAVTSGFGGDANGKLLENRQRILSDYKVNGLADSSREVLTEALNIIGLTWMQQVDLDTDLINQIGDVASIRQHSFGIVGQESGYFLDIRNNIIANSPKNSSQNNSIAAFDTTTIFSSGMEHGVLEQLQLGNVSAASTIKVLHAANQQGNKIFEADAVSYPSISSQLVNYTPTDLQNFQNATSQGSTLFIPEDGLLNINGWQGNGYVQHGVSGGLTVVIMAIKGANSEYFGGIGLGLFNQTWLIDEYIDELDWLSEDITLLALDPVDMTTGAYFYNKTDLSMGGNEPKGLHFSRTYNSDNAFKNEGMGYGWTHNYNIKIANHSDIEAGIGRRAAIDAVAMIVANYLTLDLVNTPQPALQQWMISALISNWAMDQLLNNAASVSLNDEALTFIMLPDGSYSAPPGVTTTLSKPGNQYRLDERFGTRFDFDAADQIQKITDVDNNTVTFSYANNLLQTIASSFGHSLTLGYNGTRINSVTDSTGRATSYGYDANGDLTSYTDPEDKVWGYGYGAHRMTTLTDPLTVNIATNTYDTRGNVETQTVPRQGGGTATYNFYFTDFRNIEEDSMGNQTVYFIDNKDRTVAIQDGLGNTTYIEFDGQNQVTKTIDARSNPTILTYDSSHNLRFITNALTNQTENIYDTLHRLTDTIDPLTNTTRFGYDSEHHLSLTRDALLNSFTSTYFPNGTKQTDTDARGTVTKYSYDTHGNLDTSRVAVHPIIDYSYNAIGQLQSLTDQDGATTSFLYDDRGLIKEITDPLLKKTIFTYDAVGRLDKLTDRNLKLTDFGYTPTGKVETIDYAADPTVSFAYDNRDNLDTMTDALGLTDYGYDAVNRLTSLTDPNGFTVGYRYDAAGNMDRLTYPGNKTVTYTYDALNRLKTVKIDWLAGSPTATYHYDAAGRLDSVDQFNGTITDYTYDAANRLTGLVNKKANGTVISSHQFPVLDGNGNRLREVREEPITPTLSTQKVDYNFNTPRNRLTSSTNDTFSYDDEGQQSNKSGTTYAFDDAHRLKQIGANTQFFYDGASNRLRVTRSGTTTKYIYDANNNLLAEANNSNQIQTYYIHGAGLMAMVQGNNLYAYHYDATGNTLALTNASESIINTYSYGAYGKIANESETIPQLFKYVGQYGVQYEAQNNIYYMQARYYDPTLGRFISEDPIGLEGGINLYAYVRGNPVLRTDSTGLVDWVDLGFGIIDFGLSTGEAVTGVGIMIFSSATGPAAPPVFWGGTAIASHGLLGMSNSGLAIQNALFSMNGPGLFEGFGGALFGDNGARVGQGIDLFTGLRPGAIASGGLETGRDIYDLLNTGNTARGTFGDTRNECNF